MQDETPFKLLITFMAIEKFTPLWSEGAFYKKRGDKVATLKFRLG